MTRHRRQPQARPTFTTAAEARAWEAAQWTESLFQAHVMNLARRLGWRVYHTHDSRRSAAGFPDLCMVRDRIVFAELKTAKGRIRPEQTTWLEALEAAKTEAHLWRPAHWVDGTIQDTLKQWKD